MQYTRCFVQHYNCYNMIEGKSLSNKTPLPEEFLVDVLLTVTITGLITLQTQLFWMDHSFKFPILNRMSRRVLAASASSSDLERLLYRAGFLRYDVI